MTPKGLLKAISKRVRSTRWLRSIRFARHGGARHDMSGAAAPMMTSAATPPRARLEPLAHVGLESDAVHVVIECLAQSGAQEVVIRAGGIVELDVVVRKA